MYQRVCQIVMFHHAKSIDYSAQLKHLLGVAAGVVSVCSRECLAAVICVKVQGLGKIAECSLYPLKPLLKSLLVRLNFLRGRVSLMLTFMLCSSQSLGNFCICTPHLFYQIFLPGDDIWQSSEKIYHHISKKWTHRMAGRCILHLLELSQPLCCAMQCHA